MTAEVCFVVTDAISFNVLYRGQLEYLAKRGFRLTLICGGAPEEVARLRARKVGKVVDLGLVRDPNFRSDLISLLRLLLHFAFNRFDIVVSTTPKALLLGSIACCLTAQRWRVAFFQGRVYENFTGWRRRLYKLFDRITITCCNEVLFVSRSLMSEFSREFPRVRLKGTVLGHGASNGVDPERFSSATVPQEKLIRLRSDLGISASDFVVIVVGRICLDKGLHEISQVIRRTSGSGFKFVFVGPVEGREAEAVFANLLVLSDVVHVTFTLDVTPYFALADAHLFLTHREGFGNVAIEAAAVGVPTICFDVVGVRDSVADGVSGIRHPFGDIDGVVDTLRDLQATSGSDAAGFGGARVWAVERYAQEKVWAVYAEYYGSRGKRARREVMP
jgi:glycosyltransferase involved in cell wall biosynthesis